jgi:sterol 3beta-glucosyltransferase
MPYPADTRRTHSLAADQRIPSPRLAGSKKSGRDAQPHLRVCHAASDMAMVSPCCEQIPPTIKAETLHPASFYQILNATTLLGAYSSKVIPQPPDWRESVHITGYWLPDARMEWQPSPELMAFLDAGDPPVYIGFGSMAGEHPEHLAKVVLEAIAKSGQRGLMLTGWGGLHADLIPDNVFMADSAPHSWLFPRMAAVVHHGGAGTTGEGLRAGVPAVIVHFAFDQPFWGARIKAMGLGPDPIPQKNLNADRLANAIRIAVTDAGMNQRAKSYGETIRGEDVLGKAVEVIKRCLL